MYRPYHSLYHLHPLAAQFGNDERDVQLALALGLLQGDVQSNEGASPSNTGTAQRENETQEEPQSQHSTQSLAHLPSSYGVVSKIVSRNDLWTIWDMPSMMYMYSHSSLVARRTLNFGIIREFIPCSRHNPLCGHPHTTKFTHTCIHSCGLRGLLTACAVWSRQAVDCVT